MSVEKVSGVTQTFDKKNTTNAKTKENKQTKESNQNGNAAVYEKTEQSENKTKVNQRDNETIDRLLAEAEKREKGLKDLVQKMILKQGATFNDSTDIYELLREGKVEVGSETREQAQKDIAEDGYWGVEQTSDRLVSFAKALSGGDPTKADEMMEAIKKGFGEAEKAWGGELPEISNNTLDAAIRKLEEWRDS